MVGGPDGAVVAGRAPHGAGVEAVGVSTGQSNATALRLPASDHMEKTLLHDTSASNIARTKKWPVPVC